jgi:hypothetical protein
MSHPNLSLPDKLTSFFLTSNSLSPHPHSNNQLTLLQFDAHTAALALSHAANPQNHTTSISSLRIWLREHDPGWEEDPLVAVEHLVTQITNAIYESMRGISVGVGIEREGWESGEGKEREELGVELRAEGEEILSEAEDLRMVVRHRLVTQAAQHHET